jgi:hypothetical protein
LFINLRSCLPALLAYFTEVDHSDRAAIIAIEPTSVQALGVARWYAAARQCLCLTRHVGGDAHVSATSAWIVAADRSP